MRKVIFFVLVCCGFVACAAKCSSCSSTIGLKTINGTLYCKKHYCMKHKQAISKTCDRCDMELAVASHKGKCVLCGVTTGVSVRDSGNRYTKKWGIYCREHYCNTHQLAFVKMYDQRVVCPECDKLAKQQRHAEAETEQAERRAEPLTSLFGMKLGAAHAGAGTVAFSPEKQFRGFSEYAVFVKDGKVIAISTERIFSDWKAAKSEFYGILDVMDRKYSRGRRTDVAEDGLFDLQCAYRFGAAAKDFSDAKQALLVSLERVTGALVYRLKVIAGSMDEVNAVSEASKQRDIDAL